MSIAPRSSLLVAKFAGTCACGHKVKAGESIAFSRAYEVPIVGCASCSFGTFPDASAEHLLGEARAWMALADNAMKMRSPSTGRCLTRNTLAAEAYRAALAR